jgi:hypothetical protein
LIDHQVFHLVGRDDHRAPAEALHIGKRRMRPDFDAVRFREPHRLMHDRRIGGMEAAGNIGKVDGISAASLPSR